MSIPFPPGGRRVVGDDHVDRRQVEAQRCVEPSRTNYPKASLFLFARPRRGRRTSRRRRGTAARGRIARAASRPLRPSRLSRYSTGGPPRGARPIEELPVAMAGGIHLLPFRTEQLSPPAPMVLPPAGGRVGRRRYDTTAAPAPRGVGASPFTGPGDPPRRAPVPYLHPPRTCLEGGP